MIVVGMSQQFNSELRKANTREGIAVAPRSKEIVVVDPAGIIEGKYTLLGDDLIQFELTDFEV